MVDRMVATGADEGIEFRFDIARPGNTFDAHRLLHLAADRGVQHAVKDRFLAGYHSQGVAIAEHDELTDLATAAGLDREEVTDVLAGDAYADAVRADEDQARAYGIRGVPFFVLDGQVGVSGAQPAAHLRSALEQVRARTHTVQDASAHDRHDHGPDEACVDGVCAV
jgi:predicted DsbA family dithiol-disulfide isomerase